MRGLRLFFSILWPCDNEPGPPAVSPLPERAGWSGGSGGAVGLGDFERAVRQQLGVPAGLVEPAVMAAAQHDQIVRPGRASVLDMDDVVGVAPRRRPVAAVEPAVPVAHG